MVWGCWFCFLFVFFKKKKKRNKNSLAKLLTKSSPPSPRTSLGLRGGAVASPPPVFYLHHGPPTFPGMLISESKGCGYPAPGTAEHPLPELTAGMSSHALPGRGPEIFAYPLQQSRLAGGSSVAPSAAAQGTGTDLCNLSFNCLFLFVCFP